MTDFIFVTGNQHKADFLARWLGRPVAHRPLDLPEVQSLDLVEVVSAKARAAHTAAAGPAVLVEDVALRLCALGRLPGTFIKWFNEELGASGLADLAQRLPEPTAEAAIVYALYDGHRLELFTAAVPGRIVPVPRGESWGFNSVFQPDGHRKTYAEMSETEFFDISHRGLALRKLQRFLKSEMYDNSQTR